MQWPQKWMDPASGQISFLPMEWCAFSQRPVIVTRQTWNGEASRHCVPLTYAVVVDGREVPFKLIRGVVSSSSPRPTMVVLHGMGVTAASFHGILPYVLATHDLLIVDYNSFGGRGWPAGGVSLRMMAAAVWTVVDTIGIERVSMMGSSLGGGLALLATSMQRERVDNLVLINPAAYPQDLPRMYRMARVPMIGELMMHLTPAEKFVGGVAYVGYSAPEKMSVELKRAYERNLSRVENRLKLMDIMRALPANARDMQDQLRKQQGLRQRVLILWGNMEKLLPEETGRRLARDLGNSVLVEFDDLAHLPHEEDPGRLGEEISSFLAQGHGLRNHLGIEISV